MCPIENDKLCGKVEVLRLQHILVADNIPVITFDDLCKRYIVNCWVSCYDITYLLHGWCKDSFLFAMEREIMTGELESTDRTNTLKNTKGLVKLHIQKLLVQIFLNKIYKLRYLC